MTLESLPTTEQSNVDKFYDVVRQFDPELYLIKLALKESGVNPMILPKIIRSVSMMAMGSGYGKVQIIMESHVIKQVIGEEKVQINERAIVDK